MKKLDRNVLKVWYIRKIILSLILIAGYIATIVCIQENVLLLAVVLGILLLILVVPLLIWPILQYNRYQYSYDERHIVIDSGVIFRHHIVIPVRQIQDLHTIQSPFMLLFKISGIIISTAGSNFSISAVKAEDGKQMVEDFENYLNDRLDEDETAQ